MAQPTKEQFNDALQRCYQFHKGRGKQISPFVTQQQYAELEEEYKKVVEKDKLKTK